MLVEVILRGGEARVLPGLLCLRVEVAMRIITFLFLIPIWFLGFSALAQQQGLGFREIKGVPIKLYQGDPTEKKTGALVVFEYSSYSKGTFLTGFHEKLAFGGGDTEVGEYFEYIQDQGPLDLGHLYIREKEVATSPWDFLLFMTAFDKKLIVQPDAIKQVVFNALLEADYYGIETVTIPGEIAQLPAKETAKAIFSGIFEFRRLLGEIAEVTIAVEAMEAFEIFDQALAGWKEPLVVRKDGFTENEVLNFAQEQLNRNIMKNENASIWLPFLFGEIPGLAKVEKGDYARIFITAEAINEINWKSIKTPMELGKHFEGTVTDIDPASDPGETLYTFDSGLELAQKFFIANQCVLLKTKPGPNRKVLTPNMLLKLTQALTPNFSWDLFNSRKRGPVNEVSLFEKAASNFDGSMAQVVGEIYLKSNLVEESAAISKMNEVQRAKYYSYRLANHSVAKSILHAALKR